MGKKADIFDFRIDAIGNDHNDYFKKVIDDPYHHKLSFSVPTDDVQVLMHYWGSRFRNKSTSEQFVKVYFLLLYLYQKSLMPVSIAQESLANAVGCDRKTLNREIQKMLVSSNLVCILKDQWAQSAKDKKQAFYRYDVLFLDDLDIDRSLVKAGKNLKKFERLKFNIDNLLDSYLCDNIDSYNKRSNRDIEICNVWDSLGHNELTGNELDAVLSNCASLDDVVHYLANYSDIEVNMGALLCDSTVTMNDRFQAIRCYRKWSKPVINKSNRLYHAFHCFPRELRSKYLSYNGSKLVEYDDIHNAYYVFMCKLLEDNPKQQLGDFQEIAEFENLALSGKLYETIRDATIPVNNLNIQDRFSDTKKQYRDQIKQDLQSYRNEKPGRMKSRFPEIDYWFTQNYPAVRKFLADYPKQDNGKKFLQRDIAKVETTVMTQICKEIHDKYNVTPFPLHDGIYVNEIDRDILKQNNVNIMDLALKYLDLKDYLE